MNSHPVPEPVRHDDAMPGAVTLIPLFALWQESFTLGTTWWNAMIGAYWPVHPFHHKQIHHDPHHQLVVPDPIEDEGERALLA